MISLPPLIVDQSHPIGRIRHLIRNGQSVAIADRGEVHISPRITQPIFRLANGERIVITERRNVARPPEADGVLQRLPDGRLRWETHRLIESFLDRVKQDGWPAISRNIAESWNGQLSFRAESKSQNGQVTPDGEGLRPPQLGALHAIGAHWSLNFQPATIVMPTGTGKTETMLAALAAYVRGPLLVVVPWDLLRKQTALKFLTFGLLKQLKVLSNEALNPIVGVVTKRPITDGDLDIFKFCNVIVTTPNSISIGEGSPLMVAIAKQCEALILDEAHHVAAKSWSQIREAFCKVKTLQFTATPYRRDGQVVDGKVIFNYPLGSAQRDGYFKPIQFEPIYAIGDDRSDRAIAAAAVHQLRKDIDDGFDHLLMARCESINRATQIHTIYNAIGSEFNPVLIHSKSDDAIHRISALRSGQSRIAICVDMLGEGFDLPQLKIAAVHDMHRSLAILLQFIGRFTRIAGANIGNATVVANIADPNVTGALECLYSEDADWNLLLRELSSDAAQEHAELIDFLRASQQMGEASRDVSISHQLLRPIFSTVIYQATEFRPTRFYQGLEDGYQVQGVWLHRESNTLYFVTRIEPKVRWTRSKEVRDREWALFVLHYNPQLGLLFLSSSDHSSLFQKLATTVGGEAVLISGEQVFRSLGQITRLVFQNVGVKKHGRRNLSYAMYTGGDVAQALGLAERAGSVKNNVNGTGWENGVRVSIGCSSKGRVWSREQGSIPAFVRWCGAVGAKLVDGTISVKDIIANVLIPEEVTALPVKKILGIDWPAEILCFSENRITFETDGDQHAEWPLYMVELKFLETDGNLVRFALGTEADQILGSFSLEVGGDAGFRVEQTSGSPLFICIGSLRTSLSGYFSDYPPLVRFVDLCELDGNLLIKPHDPRDLCLEAGRFEAWDWRGVDFSKESIWKDGHMRLDSVQWKAAINFIDGEFDVVFDDDGPGEAADLVCLKEESNRIRLVLVHCKFAGARTAGARISDMVEVCSQAVRSAKWKWRFRDLGQHILERDERLLTIGRPSRFLAGERSSLNNILKASRFKTVEAEILIVQPGISISRRTPDQNMLLASAATYLKETIGCELDIACSA